MAITLDDVKTYLRIDGEEEDSLLAQCMSASTSYLIGAVDDYETNYADSEEYAAKADMVRMALISEMFRNRDPSNDNRSSYPYYLTSQIAQLEYYEAEDDSS